MNKAICLQTTDAELLSEESLRYPGEEEECAAPGPNGLCCTRTEKHDGPHVAHVEDKAVAMWVEVEVIDLNGMAEYKLRRPPS